MQVICRKCFGKFGIPDKYAGQSVKCRKCGQMTPAVGTDDDDDQKMRQGSSAPTMPVGTIMCLVLLLAAGYGCYWLLNQEEQAPPSIDAIAITGSTDGGAQLGAAGSSQRTPDLPPKPSATEQQIDTAAVNTQDTADTLPPLPPELLPTAERPTGPAPFDTSLPTSTPQVASEPQPVWMTGMQPHNLRSDHPLRDITQLCYELRNSNGSALVGVGFGPEAVDIRDEAYKTYMEDTRRRFISAMVGSGLRVNNTPQLKTISRIRFHVLTGIKNKKMGKVLIGVQNGKCVYYWYAGSAGPLYRQFEAMVGLAELK